MMYQLTNEQAKDLYHILHHTPGEDCGKVASEWLSANLPAPVPVLRPIREMPREVPDGCFRLFGGAYQQGWQANNSRTPADTHFMDVRPSEPFDPETELRREFEAWMKSKGLHDFRRDRLGGYTVNFVDWAWEGYKSGKEAQRG